MLPTLKLDDISGSGDLAMLHHDGTNSYVEASNSSERHAY